MPVFNIEGPKLSKQQKSELIKSFSETASKIMNIPVDAFVIYVKENESDNIGVGGKILSDILKK